MAINNNPIYSGVGDIQSVILTAANTKSDGAGTIGTDIFKAFTADATYGGYVSSIRLTPFASVAGTTVNATVIRIFISSATSGATTSANAWLFFEIAVASQTGDSSSAAVAPYEIPINKAFPAAYTVLCTIHATPAANTGWQATVFGGKYTAQ